MRSSRVGWAVALTALIISSCSTAPKPAEEVTDRRNQAARYAEFGNAHFESARYDDALRFFELALAESRAVDDREGVVAALGSIGSVHLAVDDAATAAEYFREARRLAEPLGPRPLVEAESSLGQMELRAGRPEAALPHLRSAAELSRGLDEPGRTAIALHNLGAVYNRLDSLEEARSLFAEALAINLDQRHLTEAASNRYMLASVAAKEGDFDLAMEHALGALELDKRMENAVGIAKDLKALGLISRRRSEHDVAYDYFARSLQVFLSLGITAEIASVLEHLAETAEIIGQATQAEAYRAERKKLP